MIKSRWGFRELLFVLALALKPFYLRSSGSLQISDLIYMLLLVTFLITGKVRFPGIVEKKWLFSFLILIFYQFAINFAWYFYLSLHLNINSPAMVRSTIYYIFNFLVCLTIIQMFAQVGYERLLKLYLLGSALSLFVCYLGVALNFTGAGRERGFFNNPNQLGYYSIIVMTIFVIYCRRLKKVYRFLIIALCLVLNILSLSKASIVGSAVLLIAYALLSSDERGIKKTVAIIVSITIVTLFIYIIVFSDSNLFDGNYYIQAMRRRLLRMQYENDSDLGTGRGYDRLKEIGVWIITGVGEGAYTRFTALYGKELHSMYASTIACYGVVGFVGYSFLFCKALFSNKKIVFNIMAFSGILLYCITHNGIRNTLLWSLLAMLLLRPRDTNDHTIDYYKEKHIC